MNARKEAVIQNVRKRCDLDACKRGNWVSTSALSLHHYLSWEVWGTRLTTPRHSLPISAYAEVVGIAELPFLLTFSVAERLCHVSM